MGYNHPARPHPAAGRAALAAERMAHRKASGSSGIARAGAAMVWPGLLFVIPFLLFLPALYYSLDTPFEVISDEYTTWEYMARYDSWQNFLVQIDREFLTAKNQFYPAHTWYQGAVWQLFGPTPWAHHLARWGWQLAGLLVFIAAFRQFAAFGKGEEPDAGQGSRRWGRLAAALPLTLLVYLWFFFPNQPAARLTPHEPYIVFYLGLCIWMAARALTAAPGRASSRWTALLQYGLFCLGYAGLVFSKETNIAVALWLLLAYFYYAAGGWDAARQRPAWPRKPRRWLLLGGAPLTLLFLLALWHISEAAATFGAGYGNSFSLGQVMENARLILPGLLQIRTSWLIAAVLVLLGAALLWRVGRVVTGKVEWNAEPVFILFLLGQFASMGVILHLSFAAAPRYWYVLLPVAALLLAFSAKYLLEWGRQRSAVWRRAVGGGLAAFLVFFVAANYYDFLWQTLNWHSARQADSRLIAQITGLLEEGEYVQLYFEESAVNAAEVNSMPRNLLYYYREFLPRFGGPEYELHTAPPPDPAQPYYLVSPREHQLPLPAAAAITHREDYAALAVPRRVAGFLQGGTPQRSRDFAVYPPGRYHWNIYRLPYNFDDYAAELAAGFGASAVRPENGNGWQVRQDGNKLLYHKARLRAGGFQPPLPAASVSAASRRFARPVAADGLRQPGLLLCAARRPQRRYLPGAAGTAGLPAQPPPHRPVYPRRRKALAGGIPGGRAGGGRRTHAVSRRPAQIQGIIAGPGAAAARAAAEDDPTQSDGPQRNPRLSRAGPPAGPAVRNSPPAVAARPLLFAEYPFRLD